MATYHGFNPLTEVFSIETATTQIATHSYNSFNPLTEVFSIETQKKWFGTPKMILCFNPLTEVFSIETAEVESPCYIYSFNTHFRTPPSIPPILNKKSF
jgi:hypothetical protein